MSAISTCYLIFLVLLCSVGVLASTLRLQVLSQDGYFLVTVLVFVPVRNFSFFA
jgi:hypothetical protein